MTTPDLSALHTLTRDYAAFQTRKSGLATALGGALVLLLLWVAVLPQVFHVQLLQRPALEGMVLVPLVWLGLKEVLARRLYRGLGTVKALPDPAYERRLQHWSLGLALFLLLCCGAASYGFVTGAFLAAKPIVQGLPADHPLSHPWPAMVWLPLLYLAPMPWAIRGVEEARSYCVLVGQCVLWLIPVFLFAFGNQTPPRPLPVPAELVAVAGFGMLVLGLAVWSALALVRGWKEHLEYRSLLKSLPRES